MRAHGYIECSIPLTRSNTYIQNQSMVYRRAKGSGQTNNVSVANAFWFNIVRHESFIIGTCICYMARGRMTSFAIACGRAGVAVTGKERKESAKEGTPFKSMRIMTFLNNGNESGKHSLQANRFTIEFCYNSLLLRFTH